MMDCGNCGYWKFSRLTSTTTGGKLALGRCGNTKSQCHFQETPATFPGAADIEGKKCWGPEGGRGPKAQKEPQEA